MLWVAGLFFLALRKLSKKLENWAKLKKYVWFLPFAFLALAIAALAYAPLPWGWGSIAGLLAKVLGWILSWIGGLIGASASIIAGVLLVVVLAFGAFDLLKDRKPDAWAKGMVFAVPVLALVAAGPLAENVVEFIQNIGGWGPTVIAKLAS